MKVSIIVLTYNHEKYVAQAIEGVLKQKTTFDFEIIVANDHSVDRTTEIISEYQLVHPQIIKGYCNDSNMGGAANFRKALGCCNGEYVAICEGDDYWVDEHKLQAQVDFLDRNPDAVVAFHDALVIAKDDHCISPSKLGDRNKRNLSAFELQTGALMPTASVLFRNVIKLPPYFDRIFNSDTFLWALLGERGSAVYLDNIQPSAYRDHPGGIYSSKKQVEKHLRRIESFGYFKAHFRRNRILRDFYTKKIHKMRLIALKLMVKSLNFQSLPQLVGSFFNEAKLRMIAS